MTSIEDKLDEMWTFLSEMPEKDTLSFVLMLVAAFCLNEWAIIHYIAFVMTSGQAWTNNLGGVMKGIAGSSTVDYSSYTYPIHTSRIFIQHGINLGVAGFFSHYAILAMMFNWEAAPVIAFVPFLVDVGYFTAIDLPHLGSIPAEAQTYIISVGIICTAVFTYLNSS